MPGPPALTAAIDIHCHIFNIRDLPTYAFILDVAGDNAALRDIAAPVAKLVTEIATAAAPDYANERAVLLMLRVNPALAPTVIQFSAAPEIRFAVGLQRFLDKYTSFTPVPGPLSSPSNDDFILNVLFALFLPGVSITPGMTNQQITDLVIANAPLLASQLKSAAGPGAIPDVRGYLGQFLMYWAPRLCDYRFQLADEAASLFTDTPPVPRLLTPATLDITAWLDPAQVEAQPTTMAEQAELMRLIALIQPPKRAVHGFIGFDPWRQVDDVQKGRPVTALDAVKVALEQMGCIGVKIYPPMGFRATDNQSIPDSDFDPWLVAPYPGLGVRLDQALDALYQYCAANDVPIMAHCAASQGTSSTAALRAHPMYWRMVLDTPAYHNLRLGLGHFGGVWNYNGAAPTPADPHVSWTQDIAQMIQTGSYPNLYADFGDFAAILARTPAEKQDTQVILGRLTTLVAGSPLVRDHVMYGTDWLMLGREPGLQSYYMMMTGAMGGVLSVSDLSNFVWRNAARYLGLGTGQATRTRLVNFYQSNLGDPGILDSFVP